MGKKKVKLFCSYFVCLLYFLPNNSYSQQMNETILSWSSPKEFVSFQNTIDLGSWVEKKLPFAVIDQVDYFYCGSKIKVVVAYGGSGIIQSQVFIFSFQDEKWILEFISNIFSPLDKITIKRKGNFLLFFTNDILIGTHSILEISSYQ